MKHIKIYESWWNFFKKTPKEKVDETKTYGNWILKKVVKLLEEFYPNSKCKIEYDNNYTKQHNLNVNGSTFMRTQKFDKFIKVRIYYNLSSKNLVMLNDLANYIKDLLESIATDQESLYARGVVEYQSFGVFSISNENVIKIIEGLRTDDIETHLMANKYNL